jgi:hypothetical protein
MLPTLLSLLTAGILAVTELPHVFLARLAEIGVAPTSRVLVVSVTEQKMTLFQDGKARGTWSVSTAVKGLGEKADTHQTPRGLHRIKEKIGGGAPKGAIFDSREFKGQIWVPPTSTNESATASASSDLVTSRILWLEGLEPGKNAGIDREGVLVDSHQRFIYIHGTNSEQFIGKPASRGCIRMLNNEVIALFEIVEPGDLVWIEE